MGWNGMRLNDITFLCLDLKNKDGRNGMNIEECIPSFSINYFPQFLFPQIGRYGMEPLPQILK
jgi:hypothetical protein